MNDKTAPLPKAPPSADADEAPDLSQRDWREKFDKAAVDKPQQPVK